MLAMFNVGSASAKGPGPKPASKPTINFKQSSYTVAEGGNASIGLTRNGGTTDSTVKVNTAGGGAVGASACTADTTPPDYVSGPYTATFPGSKTAATVLIPTCNDHVYRGNRTVQLTLSDFTNGQGGSKVTALLTIVDDDPAPQVSVAGGSANEGSDVTFTVSRTGTSPLPTSLHYATSPGTAVAPTNFDATSGDLVWAGSDNTPQSVIVHTHDDGVDTLSKTFTLVLSSIQGASLSGPAAATGTINDVDLPPSISIGDASAFAGNIITFPVTLSGPAANDVTFKWATTPGTASSLPVGDPNHACTLNAVDFESVPAGAVFTILAGQTSTNLVAVQTCPDSVAGLNETFTVDLSNVTYASVLDSNAVGTIKNTVPNAIDVGVAPNTAALPANTIETITVTNMSGNGIPGITIRGEIWRDHDLDFALWNQVASGTPTTDANGQFIGTWSNTETVPSIDALVACVPGIGGATLTNCGLGDPLDSDFTTGEDTALSAVPFYAFTFMTWTLPVGP